MSDAAHLPVRDAAWRAAGFLLLWLVLAGADPADLPAAAVAVVAATWASLRLMRPGSRRVSLRALAALMLRLPLQSVVAGVGVARLALDPRREMRPGFVRFRASLPPGAARDAFCTFVGLLPGTLAVGPDENDALLVHCLHLGEPVAAQLAAEEALFVRALGGKTDHG